MLPWALGIGPVGDIPTSEEVLQALLRLQGEGGYASGDDSARVRELMSWAIQLGIGIGGLDAAYEGIFPHLGLEMLPDHELARGMPNDAPRSIEERQQRIRAWVAAKRLGRDLTIEELFAIAGTTITTHTLRRSERATTHAQEDATLSTALAIDVAQWEPKYRRGAVALARRVMPVAAYGQKHFATAEEVVRAEELATWSGPEILGRAGMKEGSGGSFTERAPSRTRSYAGTEALRARDLNRMQRSILYGPAVGADNELNTGPRSSGTLRAFSCFINNGATTAILTGDQRQKLVRIWMLHSATDRRPGQAGDTGLNASTTHHALLYTGDGSAPFQQTINGSGGSLLFGDSGGLKITNNAGATHYWVGIVELSEDVLSAGGATDVTDGHPLVDVGVEPALWTRLRDAAMRAANGATCDAWTAFPTTGYGGVVRAGVLAISQRPGAGVNTFHIDGSIDWRDRLIAVLPLGHDGVGSPNFPGTTGDDSIDGTGTIFGYTGSGEATGGGSGNYQIPFGTQFNMFAGSGFGGTLFLEHASTSSIETLCAGFLIIASDQLGARSAAVAPTNPTAPSAAESIKAYILNWAQDLSVCTQVRGRPRTQLFAGRDSDAMGLGPIVRGDPKIPVVWRMGPRNGSNVYGLNALLERDYTEEVRQPAAAGRLRRYFSATVANAATIVLDSESDWRDRMLFSILAFSAADLTIGGANQADINIIGASQVVRSSYLGSGGNGAYAIVIATNLLLWADGSTGALKITNTTGGTRYLTGVLDATFPLGPRHPVHA